MLRGNNQINLDGKGRIAIPTKYREELQECCDRQMIVTVAVDEKCKGIKGCLWLYPLPEWEKLERTLDGLPTLNKMAIKLRRFIIGNASECEMDNQGRVTIPENLRALAGLNGKVALVGQLKKFEVWSLEAWQTKEEEFMEEVDQEGKEEVGVISF